MTPALEDLLDDLAPDEWRLTHPFSRDIEECHARMFNPAATVADISAVLLAWVRAEQPCLFGRVGAAQDRLAVCTILERDLRRGDDFVQDLILAHHAVWRSDAAEGRRHGFLIALVSKRLAYAKPSSSLNKLALHLATLYLGNVQVQPIRENAILLDELFLNLPAEEKARRWRVGANYFSSQGDQRWWHDHRVPGGVVFSMNSVGHMSRALRESKGDRSVEPRERLTDWALPTAMQTIELAARGARGGTRLVPAGTFPGDSSPCPFDPAKSGKFARLAESSWNGYRGLYHTDVTVPAEYFDASADRPSDLPSHHDLDFTYLHLETEEDYERMGCGIAFALEDFEALAAGKENTP